MVEDESRTAAQLQQLHKLSQLLLWSGHLTLETLTRLLDHTHNNTCSTTDRSCTPTLFMPPQQSNPPRETIEQQMTRTFANHERWSYSRKIP